MNTELALLSLATMTLASANPVLAADVNVPPLFKETFHLSLGDYWCEQNRLSVVDVDADGRKDILMMTTALASQVGPPWSYKARAILLSGQAEGEFIASTVADFPGDYGYNIATGDLNNDGAVDFVVRASQVTHVFFNDQLGGFRKVGTAPSGYYPGPLMDVNRDGRLDIVSGSQTGSGGAVMVSTNAGSGVFFSAWQSRLVGSGYDSIQTVLRVNLNGDDVPDLATREIYGGRLITFLGTTNAAEPFVEFEDRGLGDRTFALAAGRVNQDGLDDLVTYVGWGEARVWLNLGGGRMTNVWTSPNLGQAAFRLALTDFDQDGRDDLFVGTFRGGVLNIYRNNGANGFEEWWAGKVPGDGYIGTAADLNDDGAPDLIVGEERNVRVLINRTGWPRITRLERLPEGASITWSSRPGKVYRVQYRDWWSNVAWSDLGVETNAVSAATSVVDNTVHGGANQRFYRVMEMP